MGVVLSDDVAAGQLLAAERGHPGERYILCERHVTVRELARGGRARRRAGRVPPVLPARVAKALAAPARDWRESCARPPLLSRGQLYFVLWNAAPDSAKARRSSAGSRRRSRTACADARLGLASSPASAHPEPAEDAEAVARLLYQSVAGRYDRYAGGHGARRCALLRRAFTQPGNDTSREVLRVASSAAELAGAMAAFPVSRAATRARRRFLRLALRTRPAPALAGGLCAGTSRRARRPRRRRRRALYIDSLATADAARAAAGWPGPCSRRRSGSPAAGGRRRGPGHHGGERPAPGPCTRAAASGGRPRSAGGPPVPGFVGS